MSADPFDGYYLRTDHGVLPIVAVFIGPRGSGKTTLAAKCIPQMVGNADQIECAGFGSPAIADMLNVPWHQLDATTPAHQEEAAAYFRAIEKRDDQFILVLDDSDAAWPNLTSRYVALAEFVRNNRAYGQGAVLICHGPGDVNKGIIRNAQVTFWACQSEANSIDYVRRYMKADWPLAEYRIRSLPRYTFAVWAPEMQGKAKYAGECWVENGEICFAPRNQESPSAEPPPQSESEPETPAGAETAEGATAASPTSTGRDTAASVTPRSASASSAFTKRGSGTGSASKEPPR
jgi:hypothetical protein